ncbi:MAG TPA: NAD(P)-dependent oxidoreductase [Leucothrix mucor]|uniref:NAD(P)-dependent oxidoreductase n=1 Tax=Leucothrix mucor TaxID=45248 RepID=A0A7V2T080_LEUMU|nr:NAD(P)-dependent oxidoreductase [Leucothrix mucor]
MTINIAFLGLGAMGYPMAGHLANNDFTLTVYNRTASVAEKWLTEYTGQSAITPADAVKNADIVITCVGNDNDVRSIYCGDDKQNQSIFSAIKANTILIDHTTTSANLARELAQIAAQHQAHFLDAPVSGGQVGAEKGCLTIMVGGDRGIYQQAHLIMQCYAQAISLIGSVGYGQRCKMVNQLCIAGILQGLSEALTFAKAAGIDAQTVVNTLQHGAAGSWQMVNRTETMMDNQFDFGFAIDWMRKDLAICFDEAERLQVELPLAKFVDNKYKELQLNEHARSDTSALIKQFDKQQ